MAITRPTASLGANNGTTASVTTISIPNFTVSGSNKVMYVLVCSGESTVTTPDPTVVWDSAGVNESLTRIAVSTGTGETAFLYRKIAPSDGTNKTISVTGASGTARDCAIVALYNGVDQVTPEDTINVVELAVSQNPSSGAITSPSGDWIVSFFARNGSGVPTVSGGGNSLVLTQATAGSTAVSGHAEDQDGVDDTIDYASAGNSIWTIFTFNMNAAGGGGATTRPRSSNALQLGVG